MTTRITGDDYRALLLGAKTELNDEYTKSGGFIVNRVKRETEAAKDHAENAVLLVCLLYTSDAANE